MRKFLSLIIGIISLIIGLSLVNMRVSKIKASIVTKGTVLRVENKTDGGDVMYRPVIRFINNRHEVMIFKPAAYKADNNWLTGEAVKIFYPKDRYNEASILSYWGDFGIALTFCCVAIVSLFIAGGEFLAVRFFKTLNYPDALT